MKTSTPKISVIMPVFNGGKYIEEAIKSILNQTFIDFEFIIINDGSTDNSLTIIQSFNDRRIKIINQETNHGNYPARNIGIASAQGEYICVMDSDDISLPNRLQIQYKFLEKNSPIAICGTPAKIIGTDKIWRKPMGYDDLKIAFLENNFCIHPTLMIRHSVLKYTGILYNNQFRYAADYDFISNIMVHFKVVNISNVLLEYRLHNSQITSKYFIEQQQFADLIRIKQLSNFGIYPTKEEKQYHMILSKGAIDRNTEIRFIDIQRWATYLIEKNNEKEYYHQIKLIHFLREKLKVVKAHINN